MFGDLEDDVAPDGTFRPAMTKKETKKTYPCVQCAGTGVWSGGVNRHGNRKCYACKGAGHFKTDPNKRRARKERKRVEAIKQNKANKEVFEFVSTNQDWNNFAQSLMEQHGRGKVWSEGQVAAVERMMKKMKEKKKEPTTTVNLQPIRDMFEAAVASGYKRPTYRADGLVINRAPDHGRNPGALYVKNEGNVYGGKILGTTFTPSRDGRNSGFVTPDARDHDGSPMDVRLTALEVLEHIARDPLSAALRYGQRTGRCACCGRELTNHKSVELGIGPICRERWGF